MGAARRCNHPGREPAPAGSAAHVLADTARAREQEELVFGMWYVIQVVGGREAAAMRKIERVCAADSFASVFAPRVALRRRRGGQWRDEEGLLFPGYVFVDTAEPERFAAELGRVSGLTRLLASGGEGSRRFVPISDDERALICAFTGEDSGGGRVMGVSEGVVEGGRVVVTRGPLVGREAMVAKIDRHKRLAWLEAEMFGRRLRLKVGLEIVRKS